MWWEILLDARRQMNEYLMRMKSSVYLRRCSSNFQSVGHSFSQGLLSKCFGKPTILKDCSHRRRWRIYEHPHMWARLDEIEDHSPRISKPSSNMKSMPTLYTVGDLIWMRATDILISQGRKRGWLTPAPASSSLTIGQLRSSARILFIWSKAWTNRVLS